MDGENPLLEPLVEPKHQGDDQTALDDYLGRRRRMCFGCVTSEKWHRKLTSPVATYAVAVLALASVDFSLWFLVCFASHSDAADLYNPSRGFCSLAVEAALFYTSAALGCSLFLSVFLMADVLSPIRQLRRLKELASRGFRRGERQCPAMSWTLLLPLVVVLLILELLASWVYLFTFTSSDALRSFVAPGVAMALFLAFRAIQSNARTQIHLKALATNLSDGGHVALALSVVKSGTSRVAQEGYARSVVDRLQSDLGAAKMELAIVKDMWRISSDSIHPVRKVGKGAFGEVWEGTCDVSDLPVALKMMHFKLQAHLEHVQDALQEFANEAEFLSTLRHRNIVLFHGLGLKAGLPVIVTEFLPRGSLKEVLADHEVQLPLHQRLSFAADTAAGMNFLHTRSPPRVHRDLKSGNLLVSAAFVVKVADFGTARAAPARDTQVADLEPERSVTESKLSADQTATMTSGVGTPLWQAPEVLRQDPRYSGARADAYSFGIVLAEIATRRVPYDDVPSGGPWVLRNAVLQGRRPTITEDVAKMMPGYYLSLMRACWATSPDDRPLFPAILAALQSVRLG